MPLGENVTRVKDFIEDIRLVTSLLSSGVQMGCCFSSSHEQGRGGDRSRNYLAGAGANGSPTQNKQYSWELQEKLDPKDFTFSKLVKQTKIKEPGSINGQSFIIEDCEDCDLYLLDACAQVTIDNCINCRIFIGPVESSIFIRGCKGCKCAFVCRQFRTRDCKEVDMLLFCTTRPVIEASSGMRFGCFDVNYRGIQEHLDLVKMSRWRNHWSYIHDFTPKPRNYEFLPPDSTLASVMGTIPAVDALLEHAQRKRVVWNSWGHRKPLPSEEQVFVLFFPGKEDKVQPFLEYLVDKRGLTLVHTNAVQLQAPSAREILDCLESPIKDKKSITAACSGMSVGIELCGLGCLAAVKEASAPFQPGVIITENMEAAKEYHSLGVEG